ncbi:MAG: hypothetical protein GTO02_14900, partial [Candidatus Dadabacteria bacterium]|nr:hypothetical protein [Candidatus Dadabacteria bacterium]
LLETHTCICGRQLTPTEEPYKTVEKWRNTAGLDDVEEAAQRTKASIEYIQDTRLKFYEELKDIFNNNKESMD